MITLSTRFYGLRMNLRSATRDRNHETRRSEAKPLWTINSKGSDPAFTPRLWRWMPRIDVAVPTSNLEALVDADLDTLATALYARTDDLLKAAPEQAPWRPAIGICPQISDAELVTLAVMPALL